MEMKGNLRYLCVAWAFAETLLFGGLIYGWGSLVFILKAKFVYWDLCPQKEHTFINTSGNSTNLSSSLSGVIYVTNLPPESNSTLAVTVPLPTGEAGSPSRSCPEQDSILNLVFTVGSSLFCAGCAAIGHINYKFGTRITRVISMLVFVTSTLMIAFVSPEIPWLIFPGLSLIGIGGIALLVTNTQIANLFSKGSSTIVGLLCGAFDTSAGVQLIIKLAYERGFSLQNSYFILTGLHSMVIVSTFFFLPKGFIPKPEPLQVNPEVAYKVDGDTDTPSVDLLEKHEEYKNDDKQPMNDEAKVDFTPKSTLPTLWSCVFSSSFLLQVLWLSILQLRFYYYLSSLNPLLNKVLKGDVSQVSYYTNVSQYLMMAGIVTSPFAGFVYDLMKGFYVNSRSQLRRELMPSVVPLMIGTLLGVFITILCLIPTVQVLYIIFISVTLFRSFLYCMGAAFVSAVFPSEYFGVMYGIMIICGGIFSFLQYALFRWAEAKDYTQVNYFFIFLTLLSALHPVYQWIRCRRAESVAITDRRTQD